MKHDDTELIGSSADDVCIHNLQTDIRVPLCHGAIERVEALLAQRDDAPHSGLVYLTLDRVRGSQDATVLHVKLRASLDTTDASFNAGDVGLYGLRRASVPTEGGAAPGMRLILDVTPFFEKVVRRSRVLPEVVVSIKVQRELSPPIVIGRTVIYVGPNALLTN